MRGAALFALCAILCASCLWVVPKTRRYQRGVWCADAQTQITENRVHKGAGMAWGPSCHGGDCGKAIIIGLILSPITLLVSGLYTLLVVIVTTDHTEQVPAYNPSCAQVMPQQGPPGAP